MKQFSSPNLEILGIPIGDAEFCSAVLDKKRSKVRFLLKRLEDVASRPPGGSLLLRHCGGYCKLVHLAHAVPPFSQSVLQMFDQDVKMFHILYRCASFQCCMESGPAEPQLWRPWSAFPVTPCTSSFYCITMFLWPGFRLSCTSSPGITLFSRSKSYA